MNYNYISIEEILSRLLRHPLLQSVNIEQAIQYTIDFIGIFGLPQMYLDKEAIVNIEQYRGKLPCDLIYIEQVKDCKTKRCLVSMTDNFSATNNSGIPSFKTQGQVIFTSFETGELLISYKAIAVDNNGYPMVIDDPTFLRALEAFIKKEVFTILFDEGKISPAVLQNTQQQYAWAAGQLKSSMSTPSLSEMESIKNMWCTLIQKTRHFSNGFKSLNVPENYKLH